MIIHDTITCQRSQTILALRDRAPACRACLPRWGGRQARGAGRCLFLQSIYLQSIYLSSYRPSTHNPLCQVWVKIRPEVEGLVKTKGQLWVKSLMVNVVPLGLSEAESLLAQSNVPPYLAMIP